MTITQALYDELRHAILHGQLQPGTRLPSTRALADERGVSRNTVLNAYEQLLAEGYLEGKVGSGTYVPRTLPEEMILVRKSSEPSRPPRPLRPALSKRGELLARVSATVSRPSETPRPFR